MSVVILNWEPWTFCYTMYYITHTQTENAHFEADMFIFKYVCLQWVTT